MKNQRPTLLIILDGFGFRAEKKYNAITQANTPHLDEWMKEYPHALLKASGPAVGLPEGFIGNSEVGHSTIGAGRIIKQPLTIIHDSISNGSFFTNKKLIETLHKLPKNKTLHILGLLSDAGVHSHIKHMNAFIKAAQENGIQNILLHLFLDGRDTPPQSAQQFLETVHQPIGSIHGRFYAMDRDTNWERTEKTVEALLKKQTPQCRNWKDALNTYYAQDITDEFIPPTVFSEKSFIKNGDGIIFFNFRPDRARQLTQKLLNGPINLSFFITPVSYGNRLKTTALYTIPPIENTLKEKLSKNGFSIFSIAETEKYAHVTYFFGGGTDKFEHETQLLIPSIPVKNYVEHPEMSASPITNAVIESLRTNPCDFYLINYANADMVGHSGNFEATVQAIECLDAELAKLYKVAIEEMNGTMYITADHGNAEEMVDEKTGQPKTSHTTNPVPFIMIRKNLEKSNKPLPLAQLCDIAPFIFTELSNGRST